MTTKISTPVAEKIRQALAAIAAAETGFSEAQRLLSDKRQQLETDEIEKGQLERGDIVDNKAALQRLGELERKLPYYAKPIQGLERALEQSKARLEGAKSAARAALAVGAREIRDQRTAALVEAITKLEDHAFATFCAERGPNVVVAERFAANPSLAETQLGLSLEKVATLVLRGEVPAVPPRDCSGDGLARIGNLPMWR
jgi:beta-phosphoglucomutase-like phosphatase (HAD superfamily)